MYKKEESFWTRNGLKWSSLKKYSVMSERLERGGHRKTVETEENGDSKSTNDRGPIFVVSLGLVCL
jgi:hypothetical protein